MRDIKWEITLVLVAALAILASSACSDGGGRNAATSTPVPSTPAPLVGCAIASVAKVDALVAALNAGDTTAVQQMFPPVANGWRFSIDANLLDVAKLAAATGVVDLRGRTDFAGVPSATARTPEELPNVVSSLSGLRLAVDDAVLDEGGTYVDDTPSSPWYGRELFAAELDWRATGQPLSELGWTAMAGGGKLAVDCESGVFDVVLLSPLTLER
jgi:hypothetical protein